LVAPDDSRITPDESAVTGVVLRTVGSWFRRVLGEDLSALSTARHAHIATDVAPTLSSLRPCRRSWSACTSHCCESTSVERDLHLPG